MPVGTFERLCTLLEATPADATKATAELIALLSGTTADAVERLPIAEYIRRRDALAFLNNKPAVSRGRMPRLYDVGGQRLKVHADAMKLTAAQFIDAQTLLQDGGAGRQLSGLLCCFLVPEGRSYNDGYDMDAVRQTLRDHLPVTEALRLSAFFLRLWRDWYRRTLACLEAAAWIRAPRKTREARARLRALRHAGAGWPL